MYGPKVEYCIKSRVTGLYSSDIPDAQLHASQPIRREASAGTINHLRVKVQRLDRGRAEPFEDNPHTGPAATAHFESPPARNPPAQAYQPIGRIVLAQATGRIIHRCSSQPVESHLYLHDS